MDWSIVLTALISTLSSGGLVYGLLAARSKRLQTDLEGQHERAMRELEGQLRDQEHKFELEKKRLEGERDSEQLKRETQRESHQREIAKLRSESDRDVTFSETIRLLIDTETRRFEQEGNVRSELSQSIRDNVSVLGKIQEVMANNNLILARLPRETAESLNAAMRQAVRNDMKEIMGGYMDDHEKKAEHRLNTFLAETTKIITATESLKARTSRLENQLQLKPINPESETIS